MKRWLLLSLCVIPFLTWAGCKSEISGRNCLIATGPVPNVFTVQATGIGRASPDVSPPGRARLMADAAAEADAQRRLASAVYGAPSGTLKGARRVRALQLSGGWSLVTIEMDLPSLEDYVTVLDRLGHMESPLMQAVNVLKAPAVVETIAPPQ